MKAYWALGIAGGVLIASASVHAWAQAGASESSTASNGTAIAASGSMSAKDTRKADRALRRKVYSAIVTHKEINAGNISVIAKAGAVTLDGTVVDASQRSGAQSRYLADHEAAQACFRDAIAIARQQGARSLELRTATSLARLCQREANVGAARQTLAAIHGAFAEGFDTADWQEAKALLDAPV
ncbi:BON domain-containing protein [Paraburkholderia diazotrophica]|uniref:BON domain-containing protein n=1 Tax=Paraburkholderia diazotrophica TaxID=667676 RepID=A0A1H7EA11_9BURK|nr:BON domain-containing protein [Paraburkholderia diazotrophica]SEK08922.1 BON domain-containing protein [Paraburkholderia diazotrophica]